MAAPMWLGLIVSNHRKLRGNTMFWMSPFHRPCAAGAIALALCFTLVTSAPAQTTVTYVGPASGPEAVWSDPDNWSTGVVPVNDGGALFNVIIPSGHTVTFDLEDASAITGFSLDGGQVIMPDGHQLDVTGLAMIAGLINAQGTNTQFTALGPFVAFDPGARLWASDGAHVAVASPSLTWTSSNSAVLLQADGVGSVLELTSLNSLAATSSGVATRNYDVQAVNGGFIDLSNVTAVTGAGGSRWLRLLVREESDIDFSSLRNMQGNVSLTFDVPEYTLPALEATEGSGSRHFQIPDGGTLNLPSLVTAVNTHLDIADGGTVNAPDLVDCSILPVETFAFRRNRFSRFL